MKLDKLYDNFRLTDFWGHQIAWKVNRFPDGQIQFAVLEHVELPCSLTCALIDSECLDLFFQIQDTLKIHNCTVVYLYGARSDKDRAGDQTVCNVAGLMINSISIPHVRFVAPHCDELITRFKGVFDTCRFVWPIHEQIRRNEPGYDLVIFPDESAERRYADSVPKGVSQITCRKARDQQTGNISKHEIPHFLPTGPILVMDDLCDGGRSFIDIGTQARLHGAKRVDLYVTHGIFSQGYGPLLSIFDRIYTTNSFSKAPSLLPGSTEGDAFGHRVHILDVWNGSRYEPISKLSEPAMATTREIDLLNSSESDSAPIVPPEYPEQNTELAFSPVLWRPSWVIPAEGTVALVAIPEIPEVQKQSIEVMVFHDGEFRDQNGFFTGVELPEIYAWAVLPDWPELRPNQTYIDGVGLAGF